MEPNQEKLLLLHFMRRAFRGGSGEFLLSERGCYNPLPSSQKAMALAAATFKESTPCDIGIFTV